MRAYYNENDTYAAEWLENLIADGQTAPGDVDRRSIVDVRPSDLAGYDQCHFFAGIGGWSLALRLAGWPDDRPVWTGSCPCQGFSAAGKQGGFDDDRHLWPVWFNLIRECRPGVVFGEQVASPLALAWLDLVQADMEGADYAFAAKDLCSAGVGAPHIRQRLGFVADAEHAERWSVGLNREDGRDRQDRGRQETHGITGTCGEVCGLADAVPAGRPEGWTGAGRGPATGGGTFGELADADDTRSQGRVGVPERSNQCAVGPVGVAGELADADGWNTSAERLQRGGEHGLGAQDAGAGDGPERPGPVNGFWRNADWIFCRDGKWRPVESGTFPLVNGVSGRVELVRTNEQTGQQESHLYSRTGALRGYGNAINPRQFKEFIGAYLDTKFSGVES